MTFLTTVFQDVRVSFRVLRKSPGFAITAVLTLALESEQTPWFSASPTGWYCTHSSCPKWGTSTRSSTVTGMDAHESYPDYLDLRDRNRSFEALAAYTYAPAALDIGRESAITLVERAGNYFDALKLQPYLGRFFHAADEHGANSAPYIARQSTTFGMTTFRVTAALLGRRFR